MNLNTKINKATAIIVSILLLLLFTLAFFVLKRTPITIVAYVVGVLAAILFFAGNNYFIKTKTGYPWVAAIPMTLWRYIITSTLLSGVFVIGEKLIPTFNIPALVLIIGHIIVFAFFFTMLVLMNTGKEYIESVEQKVAIKRQFIKDISNELGSIKENAPVEVKKDIQAVIDAVRYSDPMSGEAVATIENDIEDNVTRLSLKTDPEQIKELCITLIRQIKDRNNRVRSIK